MKNTIAATNGRSLPTGGEILGFVTEHLGLREAVGTDSTSQRIFRGERVKPESVRNLVTSLIAGLWTEGLSDAVGVVAEQRAKHRKAMVELVVEALQEWDARRARLYVDLRPDDTRLTFFPFLRLAALDLGLRLGAFAWLEELPQPSCENPPSWTYEDGFGRVLDQMMAGSKTLTSRARLAEKLEVTANAVSAWSRCDSFPSNDHIDLLAIELADGPHGLSKEQVEYRLRLCLLLCWARKSLGAVLGDDAARDLIEGGLWVASRVWGFADQASRDPRYSGSDLFGSLVTELVQLGARSVRGVESVRLLAGETRNPFLRRDLLALPSPDWTRHLRSWLPMMLHSEHPMTAQVLRFFPTEKFDKQAADEVVARAPEAAALSAHAYVEMTLGHFEAAASLWERAAMLEPGNAMHHYNFAMSHIRAHDESPAATQLALDECQIAVALDPTFHEAKIEVAGLLVDLGRTEEAIALYAEIKKQAPSSVRLEYDWGFALMSLGRDVEAAAHYSAATVIEPTYVDAWSNLCFVLDRAGRRREAREAAKRAEFLGHPAARMALDAGG